ncbi:MAG: hypothetical protein ACRCX2_37875 [Paraclostridium sp.]
MRYQVFSLQQSVLVDLGLNTEEALLLDWLLNWKDGNGMKREFIEDVYDMGYWLNYETVVKELPILFKQPTSDMGESELNKLLRNNKDKVARMLRGNLSKVLKPHKLVYKGKGAKLGSMIFVTINRDMIDMLRNAESKKSLTYGEVKDTQKSKIEINNYNNIIHENTENIPSKLMEIDIEDSEERNKRIMEEERMFVANYKL